MDTRTASIKELRARRDQMYARRAALNTEIQALEEALLERCIAEAVRRETRNPY
jgi:cell division protein FtsB